MEELHVTKGTQFLDKVTLKPPLETIQEGLHYAYVTMLSDLAAAVLP